MLSRSLVCTAWNVLSLWVEAEDSCKGAIPSFELVLTLTTGFKKNKLLQIVYKISACWGRWFMSIWLLVGLFPKMREGSIESLWGLAVEVTKLVKLI